MADSKVVGVVVMLGLVVALAFTIMYSAKGTTGAAVAGSASADSADHSMDGFSSYEDMMAAHHPTQAASGGAASDGCGGVPEGGHEGIAGAASGEKSEYGITYDNAGYQELMAAAKSVSLSKEQTATIVGLDVGMSCCGFKTLQATGNCECGHHVALYGLAKLLASKGYEAGQIQSEINKWKLVFFPAGGSGNTGGC